jgi:hypothetical protein
MTDLMPNLRALAAGEHEDRSVAAEAVEEIERLRGAILSIIAREGQACDEFERGRRAGLEEAAKHLDEASATWDQASREVLSPDAVRAMVAGRNALQAAAGDIRAKLEKPDV